MRNKPVTILYVYTKSLVRICSGSCLHVAIDVEDAHAECVPVVAWVCPTHILYASCGESHVLLGGCSDLRVECVAMSVDRLFACRFSCMAIIRCHACSMHVSNLHCFADSSVIIDTVANSMVPTNEYTRKWPFLGRVIAFRLELSPWRPVP